MVKEIVKLAEMVYQGFSSIKTNILARKIWSQVLAEKYVQLLVCCRDEGLENLSYEERLSDCPVRRRES